MALLRRTMMIDATNTAQNPHEPFDIIHADGTPTGRVKARAAVHRDGDWHRAIHVWVAGKSEGTPFLMFQRRSRRKDTWPGLYDATVGGHYRARESTTETLREVEEEIGISADGLALRPLGIRVCANEAVPGIVDRELQDVFLLLDDRPLEEYHPDPVELAALVRFELSELLSLLTGETATASGVSLSAGDHAIEPITAALVDFIPTVDRYFLRVAIAAGLVMRGEHFVAV
jgi:isopentenyldiphosphate isomerase